MRLVSRCGFETLAVKTSLLMMMSEDVFTTLSEIENVYRVSVMDIIKYERLKNARWKE